MRVSTSMRRNGKRCTSAPGCTTAARSPRPSTWWTRRPSWRPCTTASTRCARASRCSSAMPESTTGAALPKAATRPRCAIAAMRCWPRWTRNSPSSPIAMSAASSFPRTSNSACARSARGAGPVPSTTGWACRATNWRATPVRPRHCRRKKACWRTGPSTASSARWRKPLPRTTAGGSAWTCRSCSMIAASCTTSRSAAAR